MKNTILKAVPSVAKTAQPSYPPLFAAKTMRNIFTMLLLCVSVMGWAEIDWENNETYPWLGNGGVVSMYNDKIKATVTPALTDQGINNLQTKDTYASIHIAMPSAEFGAISLNASDYTIEGSGFFPHLNAFTKRETEFTVVCGGTTYTFTVYNKDGEPDDLDGWNIARGKPSYAGYNNANAWQTNDNDRTTRWGSEGAKHYATYGDAAEDWWAVDLGGFYEISEIKILCEGAYPTDFDILTSVNGTSWVVRGTYGEPTNKGNAAENAELSFNGYPLSPSKVARYVKIFARNGFNNMQYGISMWEVEVYGTRAVSYDTNAPTLTSAEVSGTPTTTEIQLAVSASDTEDGTISLYRVRENSLNLDHNFVAIDGKITMDGLLDGTDYSFTITALDNIGNQSNAIVVNVSTAADPANPATMAPEPPARSVDDVRAIYSDAYADILMHDFLPGTQWSSVAAVRRVKNGNNYLLYDISSGDNITWGLNDGGANAIVAKDGYHSAERTGLDASGMQYLHVDIWSLVALTNINVKINDAVFTTITHDGNGWQSYDLTMEGSTIDFTDISWLKLDGITSSETRGKAAVDNYYFWKAASGVKAVVVSSNNGSWGSATAKVADKDVTSVETGTEVTFAAEAQTGYDFAYWQIGETKVYDNPYVVAVDANITAVATFEPERTAYCSTPVTDTEGRTLYLTISKTENANEYKILLEGSVENRIESAYDNIQLQMFHINGEVGNTTLPATSWTVDNSGYGTAYVTFTADNFRDVAFVNKYVVFNKQGGGLTEFNAFPDASLIKWDATCTDDEAPVLAAPFATPLSGTSVRLALSATDNMVALLTYAITYDGHATPIEVPGAAGETTYYNIKGLSAGTNYTFSVTVSDGTNVSAAQTCTATPSMPTAPVPVHNEAGVLSVYSDKYESALEHDFNKNTWVSPTFYTEQNIEDDHMLVYNSDDPNSMPQIAWGVDNDGEEALIAKDGYNDGTNKGLDVRAMDYLHFDMWSSIPSNLANVSEVTLNNDRIAFIQLAGSGWQSFDLPISGMEKSKKNNVRFIKFQGLRDPNPEEIAIDNVYFWKNPEAIILDQEATDNTTTLNTKNGVFATVTIQRSFTADNLYTLVLPFDVDAAQRAEKLPGTLTKLGGVRKKANDDMYLNFVNASSMEAGVAYLYTPSTDVTNPVFENVVVKKDLVSPSYADDGYTATYTGIYDATDDVKTALAAVPNSYILGNDRWLYEVAPMPETPKLAMNAFRGYFILNFGTNAAPGRRARIVFGDIDDNPMATDLEYSDNTQLPDKRIEHGQLLIIRNGHTYNAQGQLLR